MPDQSSDPSVTQQVKHDAICLEFEQAWRHGERRHIESYLEGSTDQERAHLLPQLLLLELEYLQQGGAPPEIDSYLARFPNETEQVRAAFADHAAAFGRGADGSAAGRSRSELPENTVDLKPLSERPGSEIDRYKLLEQIGEGGMGVVYMARTAANRSAARGVEDHQTGNGHTAGDRSLRGRTASAGDDGSSQHRARVRRRTARRAGRPLLRHGTGAKACRSRNFATEIPTDDRESDWSCFMPVCLADSARASPKGVIHRDHQADRTF